MAKFYQVGGSVRDELLGLKSKDIDYAVECASFDAMRKAILERGGEIFLETPQYLTIRAKVPSLGACDFVLCRKDGEYQDGRRPEGVEPGTILDDLARRDFTMNALAKGENGVLLDPHGGQEDIAKKVIKCVGDTRERFSEDGLRMIRAIRFAITKGFWISNDIHNCLVDEPFYKVRLSGVSPERVREELIRCFKHDTIRTLYILGIYSGLSNLLFLDNLWLKPTLERR